MLPKHTNRTEKGFVSVSAPEAAIDALVTDPDEKHELGLREFGCLIIEVRRDGNWNWVGGGRRRRRNGCTGCEERALNEWQDRKFRGLPPPRLHNVLIIYGLVGRVICYVHEIG